MQSKLKWLSGLAVIGLMWTASASAQAVTKTWKDPVNGRFNDPARWAPAGVPQNGDDVNIGVAGTYIVTYTPGSVGGVPQTDFSSLTLGGGAGTQTLSKTSNTLNTTSGLTVNTSGVLTQGNGNLGGAGAITNSGTFNFNGGAVTPGGTFNVTGSGTLILGTANKTLQRDLTSGGAINWPAGNGSLLLSPGVAVTNNSLFQINTNAPITRVGMGANPTITNNGNLNKDGGGTTQLNGVNFTNTGGGPLGSHGIALFSGTLSVNGAFLQSGTAVTYFLGAGTTLASTQPVNITGGAITGGGAGAGGNIQASVVNNSGGDIQPGAGAPNVGTINITGNYTQSGSGSYSVDINGTTAGTQYDVLNVGGAATLAGPLNANVTYSEQGGDVFEVLKYGSRSGTFSPVNVTGAILETQYNPNNLRLIAAILTATITTPQDGGYVSAPQKVVGTFTRNPQINGNTGLQSAQITIVENQTGFYWNGSSFVNMVASFPAEFVNPVNGGFGTNKGPGTNDATDGFTYTITATATDANGNSVTSEPVTVTSDKLRPTITSDNAPVNRSTITSLPTPLTGTATDPNGALSTSSGLRDVRLTLIRNSDKMYWNGTTWQTAFVQLIDPSATTAPNSGTPVPYSFSNLPQPGNDQQTDLTPDLYSLAIISYDRTGKNSSTGSISRTFTVTNAPMVQRKAPSGGAS